MQSYWNNNGRYQNTYNELFKRIPDMGACKYPRSINRNLEKLRVAGGAYYDLFNNGGMNRMGQIRQLFKIYSSEIHPRYGKTNWDNFMLRADAVIDQLIKAAAEEQFITLVDDWEVAA